MDKEELVLLVERAQSGDGEALESLLVACEPGMQRLARRYCPARDAEDAVQEILMRTSEQIGALRVAQSFVSWSLRMLVRECYRFQRRSVSWVLGDSADTVGSGVPLEELRLQLSRGLRGLNVTSRDILLQHEVLGHTKEESAKNLGLSLEAAKSRLRRARGELRANLES